MAVTREYLTLPQFAGLYGGGGNRTRVPLHFESPGLQRKRALTAAAYQACNNFILAFEVDLYRNRDYFGDGQETNLYFICETQDDGPFKVGLADDPLDRLKSLQLANPRELGLFAAVPATKPLEKHLHRVLRRDRIRGEWFRPGRRTLALAECFLATAQQLADMEDNECGPVDAGDALITLSFRAADADAWAGVAA